jgi:hypothetical protein
MLFRQFQTALKDIQDAFYDGELTDVLNKLEALCEVLRAMVRRK